MANYKVTSSQLAVLGSNIRNQLDVFSLPLKWSDIESFAESGIYARPGMPVVLELYIGNYSKVILVSWDIVPGDLFTSYPINYEYNNLTISGTISWSDIIHNNSIDLTLTGDILAVDSCLETDLSFNGDIISFSFNEGDYRYEFLF